jgi:hypothetical protein
MRSGVSVTKRRVLMWRSGAGAAAGRCRSGNHDPSQDPEEYMDDSEYSYGHGSRAVRLDDDDDDNRSPISTRPTHAQPIPTQPQLQNIIAYDPDHWRPDVDRSGHWVDTMFEWYCHLCTLRNQSERTSCRMCNWTRIDKDLNWVAIHQPSCTYLISFLCCVLCVVCVCVCVCVCVKKVCKKVVCVRVCVLVCVCGVWNFSGLRSLDYC